jgi:hypothetical protein
MKTMKKQPYTPNDLKGPRSSLILSQGYQRPGDPSADQTRVQIADYYREAKEGDPAVIRETYAGRLWFIVTTVTNSNPKSGRVYLKDTPQSGYANNGFYMKSGKSCFAPTGQSSIVMPTPEVLEHAAKHPHKKFGFE